MNAEQLFEQIKELEDELLLQSETPPQPRHFSWNQRFRRWGRLAACTAVAAAIIVYGSATGWHSFLPREQAGSNDFEAKKVQPPKKETMVSPESLQNKEGQNLSEKSAGLQKTIPVASYQAVYEEVDNTEKDALGQSLGTKLAGQPNWYRLFGHSDQQYLISSENGTCRLWKFCYFKEENYPYSDVLTLVYNIHSAADMKSLVSRPADLDNSDQGRMLQAEIGELPITGRNEMEDIYQILTSMTCLGGGRWDAVDLGDDLEDGQANAVRRGRYLTITTADGNVIDTLKYTAYSNMFYEYGGVAYTRLSEPQADQLKRMLKIDSEADSGSSTSGIREETKVDTAPLQEPADTGAAGSAKNAAGTDSYAEIASLQENISLAMQNHELPFVRSSAILEQPYRVHVVVTTDQGEELQKLKALDTRGGLIEIEYQPGAAAEFE